MAGTNGSDGAGISDTRMVDVGAGGGLGQGAEGGEIMPWKIGNTYGAMNAKHGFARKGPRSPEYNAWCGIFKRCYNPKHHAYQDYGGRGITVCQRWRDFTLFLADVGKRPASGYTLDRFPDNNGNYEPGNTRWATWDQQLNNRRFNVVIERSGERLTISQWAKKVEIKAATLYWRASHGRSVEEIFAPVRVQK